MKSELIEKLALIYVSKNLEVGAPPAQALELYKKATEVLSAEKNSALAEHLNSGSFHF